MRHLPISLQLNIVPVALLRLSLFGNLAPADPGDSHRSTHLHSPEILCLGNRIRFIYAVLAKYSTAPLPWSL